MGSVKTFEDLNCWKEASKIRKELNVLVRTFPSEEKYRLTDQIIRASRSVTANIAEGYGRFHYQENIQFCRQARGSYYELIDHLIIAHDENFVSKDNLESFKEKIYTGITILNGFINYLIKAKSENKNMVSEPDLHYGEQSPIND